MVKALNCINWPANIHFYDKYPKILCLVDHLNSRQDVFFIVNELLNFVDKLLFLVCSKRDKTISFPDG